jgi:multicomponent Na+:H+ antiporter subunit E
VARRALSPDMKLRPGLARYTPGLPAGPARSFFLTVASLQPITVPAGWDRTTGALMIHCLDTGQPVAADMAIEEARMAHALGNDAHGGYDD